MKRESKPSLGQWSNRFLETTFQLYNLTTFQPYNFFTFQPSSLPQLNTQLETSAKQLSTVDRRPLTKITSPAGRDLKSRPSIIGICNPGLQFPNLSEPRPKIQEARPSSVSRLPIRHGAQVLPTFLSFHLPNYSAPIFQYATAHKFFQFINSTIKQFYSSSIPPIIKNFMIFVSSFL